MRTQIYPLFCKRTFTLCWGMFFPQPSGSSAWGGIWLQDGRIKKRGLSELLSSRVPLDLCLENVFFSFFQFFIRRQWLYTVVLVSTIAKLITIHIYIHSPSWAPFPFRFPRCIEFPVLSSMFSLVISSTQCQSQCLNSSHATPTPLISPLVSIYFFCVCISISALQIRSSRKMV